MDASGTRSTRSRSKKVHSSSMNASLSATGADNAEQPVVVEKDKEKKRKKTSKKQTTPTEPSTSNETPAAEVSAPAPVVDETKKVKKKAKKVEFKDLTDEEATRTPPPKEKKAKSRKKIKTTDEANVVEPETSLPKATPKRPRAKSTDPDTSEKVQPKKDKTKSKKKTKKAASSEKTETPNKPKRTPGRPKTIKVVQQEAPVAAASPVENDEVDDFKLQLDENDDEVAGNREEPSPQPNKSSTSIHQTPINVVDTNTTMPEVNARQSIQPNQLTEENTSPAQVEEKAEAPQPTPNESSQPEPAPVSSTETTPESDTVKPIESQVPAVEGETQPVQPPKRGGARIVKPKELVNVVKIIKKDNVIVDEQVETKVVEVVNREAGPRIVKPVIVQQEASISPKRKAVNTIVNKVKKLKETFKPREPSANRPTESEQVAAPAINKHVPDFKSIHEKGMTKMESIEDYAKRREQRHAQLTDKPTSSSTPVVVNHKTTTPCSSTNDQASSLTSSSVQKSSLQRAMSLNRKDVQMHTSKPAIGTTPSANRVLKTATSSSNIPVYMKLAHRDKEPKTKENIEPEEPTTGEAKTPSAQRKAPRDASVNKSAIKIRPDCNTSIMDKSIAQAPNSYVRRKSFDLNASLSRELTYKPYTGKLKPLDLDFKPAVTLSQVAKKLNP